MSKRLVCPAGGAIYKPHEALANKAVFYIATDAIAVMSYSGAAYIAGKNTDNWIAETLDPTLAGGPQFAFQAGGSGHRITIGAAMQKLGVSLDHAFAAMPFMKRQSGIVVQIVGFKWRRRKPRRFSEIPFVWHLWNTGADGATTAVERRSRYWGWEKNESAIHAIGDRRFDPAGKLSQWLIDNTGNRPGINDVETTMVDIVRGASSHSGRTIGRECISVLLSLTDDGTRIRYFSESPAMLAFTPWILFPGAGTLAPSVIWGSPPQISGTLPVTLERVGPPSELPDVQALKSLKRQPEP